MGMYDDFFCAQKFLPEGYPSGGWRTKHSDCNLNYLQLKEDGVLYYLNGEDLADENIEAQIMHLTGRLRFYQTIGGKRVEFVVEFVDGVMKSKPIKL